MKNCFKLTIIVNIFLLVTSQSCREYGRTCNDDKACCGGCCINGVCIDTYADCRIKSRPCREHQCPPDQECYAYKPKDCKGCGAYAQCRLSLPAPIQYETLSTETSTLEYNLGGKLYSEFQVLVVSLIMLFINSCYVLAE